MRFVNERRFEDEKKFWRKIQRNSPQNNQVESGRCVSSAVRSSKIILALVENISYLIRNYCGY